MQISAKWIFTTFTTYKSIYRHSINLAFDCKSVYSSPR